MKTIKTYRVGQPAYLYGHHAKTLPVTISGKQYDKGRVFYIVRDRTRPFREPIYAAAEDLDHPFGLISDETVFGLEEDETYSAWSDARQAEVFADIDAGKWVN